MIMLLFDVAVPGGGPLVTGAAIGFFLVLAAVAIIAFLLLKRVLRTAFRLAIVGVLLAAALAGAVGIWWVGSAPKYSGPARRPTPTPLR